MLYHPSKAAEIIAAQNECPAAGMRLCYVCSPERCPFKTAAARSAAKLQ